MTGRHAVHFLEEFDGGPESPVRPGAVVEFDSLFASRQTSDPADETETSRILQAREYDRGFADAQEQARQHYEALLKERECRFEARIESERSRWGQELAKESAKLIKDEIRRCEYAIGEQVARLLLPVLESQLTRKSVGEIRDLVRRLLTDAPDSHLRISGPPELTDAMRAALGENGLHATILEGEGLELRVEIDQVVVESRVATWVQRLREVLE